MTGQERPATRAFHFDDGRSPVLVKMRVQLSGTRDGVEWPAAGETVEVTDDEGASLVANALADAAEDKPAARKGKEQA